MSEELEVTRERARLIRSLLNHPGWKIVEEYLLKRREAALHELAYTPNQENIRYLQVTVQVIDGILSEIQGQCFQGALAEEMLRGET